MTDAARSLGELLARRAALSPDVDALRAPSIDGGVRTLDFATLDRDATRLARGLRRIGVATGEPVAFLFSNDAGVEAVTSYCAIHKAGAVAVPINGRFVGREIAQALSFAKIPTLLYEHAFDERVADALEAVPHAVRLVRASPDGQGDALSWHSLLDDGPDAADLPRVSSDQQADWLYTSGTTGRPKCVMLTHANCLAAGASLAGCFRLEQGDRHLTPSPFFTSSGCHTSLLSSMTAGATYVMSPSPRAEDLMELIQSERATAVGAVPSIFAYMHNSELAKDADMSAVKLVYHGGAAVSAGLVLQIQELFPNAEVINVYGQTESGNPGTVLRGEWSVAKAGSIGREGMPDVEVRVVDEAGEVVTPPAVGEVCLRSAAVMRGYLDDPEETANVMRDGWLHTGDLVRVDDEGFMYVYDRKKDMIVRGGHNIASIEVENVLDGHPAVVESAVVGKPHPTLGEDVCAYVVATAAGAVSVEELREFCSTRLADYKIPRDFRFLDELPRNPTGKILKRDLRTAAAADAPVAR